MSYGRKQLLVDAQRPCCNRTYHSVLTPPQSLLLKQWYATCAASPTAEGAALPQRRQASPPPPAGGPCWRSKAAKWPPPRRDDTGDSALVAKLGEVPGRRIGNLNAPVCSLAGGGGLTAEGTEFVDRKGRRTIRDAPENQWRGPRAGDNPDDSMPSPVSAANCLREELVEQVTMEPGVTAEWVQGIQEAAAGTTSSLRRRLPPATAPYHSGSFRRSRAGSPSRRQQSVPRRPPPSRRSNQSSAPWASWSIGRTAGRTGWELPGKVQRNPPLPSV